MTNRTLSLGPEKLKISKCSVSNQISREVCICLVWVLYVIISSINTPQSYLFMTQVDFMLFLRLWVWLIQALPNHVWCFPNSKILFLKYSTMYVQSNKIIYNRKNHMFSLILNLTLDSSPCSNMKTNEFQKKTFWNVVFGYDFASNETIWIYHDLFYIL